MPCSTTAGEKCTPAQPFSLAGKVTNWIWAVWALGLTRTTCLRRGLG